MTLYDPAAPVEKKVRIVRPTLGGRSSLMANSRSTHLFGALSTDIGNPQTSFQGSGTEVPRAGLLEKPKYAECERLWRIRSAGVEVIRESAAPLPPLARTAVVGTAQGLGPVAGFKLLVDVGASSGQTTLRMDIGETLDILGYSVNVAFLGPANAVEVGSNQAAAGTRAGIISDAVVGFSLNMIEEADCHCEVTYTQLVNIPSGAASTFAVPRFAKALKVQFGTGTAAAAWTKHIDPAPGILATGTLAFNAAGTVSTDNSKSVAGANFISTDTVVAVRFASLIWTIRP